MSDFGLGTLPQAQENGNWKPFVKNATKQIAWTCP